MPITDSVSVKNSDVFIKDAYLGRLWVFPTQDPNLNAMGINSEWFLVSSTGQVASGHVNTDEQWSISPNLSLLPSREYTSLNEVFERVFYSSIAENQSALEMNSPSMQLGERSSNSDDSDSTEESNKFNPQLDATTFANLIVNLDKLTNLLADKFESDIEAQFDELDDEERFSELEEDEDKPVLMLPLSSSSPDIIVTEEERFWWQNALIDWVVEELLEREVTEVQVMPNVELTVNVEEDYFLLHSSHDGHTLLSASLAGEVIKELNNTDASYFVLLEQILPIDLSNRSASKSITDSNVCDISSQKREIEYGD
ncbi:MAG: hypothetical protein U7127_30975 (plasmid) [Phormidium sp.]